MISVPSQKLGSESPIRPPMRAAVSTRLRGRIADSSPSGRRCDRDERGRGRELDRRWQPLRDLYEAGDRSDRVPGVAAEQRREPVPVCAWSG